MGYRIILIFVSLLLCPNLWGLALIVLFIYWRLFLSQGQGRARLLRRVLVLWGFVLVSVFPLLWASNEGGEAFVHWGYWEINSISLYLFGRTALRAIGGVGILLWLSSTYPPYRMFSWMRRHLPTLLVELMELTYRYIYILEEMVQQIALAQVSRLGYQGWRNKLRHTNMLLSRTFILTHIEAEEVYNGLLSRGYEEQEQAPRSSQSITNLSMKEVLIELEEVRYAYEDEQDILRGVNLQIYSGEKILVEGINGSGKSTLFAVLSGIYPRSGGVYRLYGEALDLSSSSLRRIRSTVGFVFQNSNHQLFCPSVRDEIAFGLRNQGYSPEEVEKKTDQVLLRFDLLSLQNKAPHQLSEGQKKWVALAAILAIDPDIIILDEPTACLDSIYTHRIMKLLDELHEEGKTIILSTHDSWVISKWDGRRLFLNEGRFVS